MLTLSGYLNKKFSSVLYKSNIITFAALVVTSLIWGQYSTRKNVLAELNSSSVIITSLMHDQNWDLITQYIDQWMLKNGYNRIIIQSKNQDELHRIESSSSPLLPSFCQKDKSSELIDVTVCSPFVSNTILLVFLLTLAVYSLITYLVFNFSKKRFLNIISDMITDLANTLDEKSLKKSNQIVEFHEIRKSLLLKSKELQKAVEDSTYIMATRKIAHDIMSPLSVISQIATNYTEIKDSEVMQISVDHLKNIAKGLLYSTGQRNDYKSYSRINVWKEINLLMNAKKIEMTNLLKFEYILELSKNTYLWFNLSEFKRIISNIVNNSLEANNQKSNIQISFHDLRIDGFYQLSIKDNGPGFEDGILNKLKEGIGVTTKVTGFGIGLNSAFEAIHKINGTIRYKNNNGAEVLILVPDTEIIDLYIELSGPSFGHALKKLL